MNILQNLSNIKNKHCYFYPEQDENDMPFSLDIDINNTKYHADYDNTYQPLTNVHIGQRKLLISEIQLLNEYYKNYAQNTNKQPLVVYIGSAPGSHLIYLHKLFPKMKFRLYDGAEFDKKLKNIKQFEIYEGEDGYITIEKIHKLKETEDFNIYDILFISDIRLSADNIDDFEENVLNDLKLQQEFIKVFNPLLSLLKFKVPYNLKKGDKFKYNKGTLLYGIWPPSKSTETRLLIKHNENNIEDEYDAYNYESTLFYHNKFKRPFTYNQAFTDFPYHISQTNMYCPCYDCYAELSVLKEFYSISYITGTTLTEFNNIVSYIYEQYEDKIWSKTWDENIAIEKQLNYFEDNKNDIVGVNRHVSIETNNILIVIPKVNIYELDDFETLFNEYIMDFYDIIKNVSVENSLYYDIVILQQLPYKENIYYGALLNSAFTIAKYSKFNYSKILFHEPFLKPNRKLVELYLSNSINEKIIYYSNLYKSAHPLSVFQINLDIFENINGFPNNISDIHTIYNVFLDRIKQSGYSTYNVIGNNKEHNSIFYNINYEDYIADVRPDEIKSKLSKKELNEFNIIRDKSNYDNWCGLKQKFYFNTINIDKYIDNKGLISDIIVYTIELHNSCNIYNDIDLNMEMIEDANEINNLLINFIKYRSEKYLGTEKFKQLDSNTILFNHITNENYIGIEMNYGEYIENILNILEESFLFVNLMKSNNEDINNVLKILINKWFSYIYFIQAKSVLRKDKTEYNIELSNLIDPRYNALYINEINKITESSVEQSSYLRLKKIHNYSQHELNKYLVRTLFFEYNEGMIELGKYMLEYRRNTYMNFIIHNMNINKVNKVIDDFELSIN